MDEKILTKDTQNNNKSVISFFFNYILIFINPLRIIREVFVKKNLLSNFIAGIAGITIFMFVFPNDYYHNLDTLVISFGAFFLGIFILYVFSTALYLTSKYLGGNAEFKTTYSSFAKSEIPLMIYSILFLAFFYIWAPIKGEGIILIFFNPLFMIIAIITSLISILTFIITLIYQIRKINNFTIIRSIYSIILSILLISLAFAIISIPFIIIALVAVAIIDSCFLNYCW